MEGKCTFSVYTSIFWPSRTNAVSVVTEDSSAGVFALFSTGKFSGLNQQKCRKTN
jgi:hypothetical protein